MQRLYSKVILHHLTNWDQMVFIEGARQAGKTTIAKELMSHFEVSRYLNWDNLEDRAIILSGQKFIEKTGILEEAARHKPLVIFDELHKMPHWKNYLKGFYDTYKDKIKIIVTGSAKLSVYKKGQDSLMGRYFPYSIYPLSYGEVVKQEFDNDKVVSASVVTPDSIGIFDNLYRFGGFPDPFIKKDKRFHSRWSNLRIDQLFREDINVVEDIKNVHQLETLAYILNQEATSQVNYSKLSQRIQVSDQTVRKWFNTLEDFYYGFTIRPWHHNIARAILKEPKFYMLDWSNIVDNGSRAENFIACHLKKAVSLWNDTGQGEFELFYIRDKEKREVDFVITRDNKVWFLVEVKSSNNSSISEALYYFQEVTKAEHAFQVVIDMPYKDIDCFTYKIPVKVPALTFLSQLS